MDQLMQANLQIIELLGAVFEEVERQGERAAACQPGRPSRPRTSVGRPQPERDIAVSRAPAMN